MYTVYVYNVIQLIFLNVLLFPSDFRTFLSTSPIVTRATHFCFNSESSPSEENSNPVSLSDTSNPSAKQA